jgi:monovalent cation/hydrogen antiporter
VWVSLRVVLFRGRRSGQKLETPSWRIVVATSLAGVRGAITLAGVLTLPLALSDGSAFPARDLAIFLAAGVIICTLVAASIGLPHLLKGLHLPPEPPDRQEEDEARVAAAEAAIKAIENLHHAHGRGRTDADLYADAGARIMAVYRRRIEDLSQPADPDAVRSAGAIERRMRLTGLRAERGEINRLVRARKLPEHTARSLIGEIDLLEARITMS